MRDPQGEDRSGDVSCPARGFRSGSGSWYPRGLTPAPEWLCLWLGEGGYSSGNKQLPKDITSPGYPTRRGAQRVASKEAT